MPTGPTLFASGSLEVYPLWLEVDLPSIETLCRRCEDYYVSAHGEPADALEARKIFEEVPPGLSPADKSVLGVFDAAARLVGVIEVVRGYRLSRDWYIGLLLLEPAARGRGTGRGLHGEFARWARRQGVERLLLAVLAENARARAFWQGLGYRLLKTYPPRVIGRRTHVLEEMELSLESAAPSPTITE